jgi:membrane protein YdbS with pleckstrin-like domain
MRMNLLTTLKTLNQPRKIGRRSELLSGLKNKRICQPLAVATYLVAIVLHLVVVVAHLVAAYLVAIVVHLVAIVVHLVAIVVHLVVVDAHLVVSSVIRLPQLRLTDGNCSIMLVKGIAHIKIIKNTATNYVLIMFQKYYILG